MSKSSPRKLILGVNDLQTTHPEVAAEAFGWDPQSVTAGSGLIRTWSCRSGHTWTSRIQHRANGAGCPYCSGHRAIKGVNDLATVRPALAAEADGWDPSDYKEFSDTKLKWRCSNGHSYLASPAVRSKGSGCPYCGNRKILIGFNDLATRYPAIAEEAFGWDPKLVLAGSQKKLPWKCKAGHTWTTSVKLRTRHGSGCPFCSGLHIDVGVNDLKVTHPEVAAQAFGWDPSEYKAGSNVTLRWKCQFGHIYEQSPNQRTRKRPRNCPYCSGHKLLSGFNDLATTHPELATQADGWDPTAIQGGSRAKRRWICEHGHRWVSSLNVRTLGSGCPTCAKTGFDPNMDGWLYLMVHELWGLTQIGISNRPDDRIGRHRQAGWELLDLRGPLNGFITKQWEADMLLYLRERGVRTGLDEIAGRFSGYTESWRTAEFPVLKLWDLMTLIDQRK